MVMVECEVRSFVTDEQYERLLVFFGAHATDLGVDHQITHYLDAPLDLRIQSNDTGAKIWLKKGKLHDEEREEIEIPVARELFPRLQDFAAALGYTTTIEWRRTRHQFRWSDIDVSLDDTQGYGRILELEKRVSRELAEETVHHLKTQLAELGIPLTPKQEFERRYAYYREHWPELVEAAQQQT